MLICFHPSTSSSPYELTVEKIHQLSLDELMSLNLDDYLTKYQNSVEETNSQRKKNIQLNCERDLTELLKLVYPDVYAASADKDLGYILDKALEKERNMETRHGKENVQN
ncbi:unnamed protein product [Soboliphyme baturini]|uniref:CAPRIN2 n=1 Tax=Soboliphyme baturini TaxID=241478 RepID=A0A183IAA4_9BILA|nr:unnamed protein product [Soboliphyme baturini]